MSPEKEEEFRKAVVAFARKNVEERRRKFNIARVQEKIDQRARIAKAIQL